MLASTAHLDLLNRRQFFRRGGVTLGSTALAGLLQQSLGAAPTAQNPQLPRKPHFAAKAKRSAP